MYKGGLSDSGHADMCVVHDTRGHAQGAEIHPIPGSALPVQVRQVQEACCQCHCTQRHSHCSSHRQPVVLVHLHGHAHRSASSVCENTCCHCERPHVRGPMSLYSCRATRASWQMLAPASRMKSCGASTRRHTPRSVLKGSARRHGTDGPHAT